MLQALLVVPAFALAYLIAAPTPLRKRIVHLLAAGAAMVVSAGWWVAIVELVPASARPYIGGSQTNSILELTFGYNGLGRITGDETGSVGGGGGAAVRGGMWGATGLTRMFNAEIGGQISWLIPARSSCWSRACGCPRPDAAHRPRRAAYIVWGGWLLVTGLTFRLMAGIFHAYYTVALAPAIGALVGMGGEAAVGAPARLVRRRSPWPRRRPRQPCGPSCSSPHPGLVPVAAVGVLVLGMAAAFLFLVVVRLHRRAVPLVLAGALVAGLAGPAAYTLSTVSTPHTGSIPTAGPSGQGGMGGPAAASGGGPRRVRWRPSRAAPGGTGARRHRARRHGTGGGRGGGMGGLLDAQHPEHRGGGRCCSADAARYTWVAAAIGSQNAAGYQLATELPVMAIGGFNGSDPSPTLAQFQALVQAARSTTSPRQRSAAAAAVAADRAAPRRLQRHRRAGSTAHFTAAVTIGGLDVLRPRPSRRQRPAARPRRPSHRHAIEPPRPRRGRPRPQRAGRRSGACVRRLHDHLRRTFPYPFRITVADNASTDGTWAVASRLAEQLPEVRAVHLDREGPRPGAQAGVVGARTRRSSPTWTSTSRPTSTPCWPLVAPLMSGPLRPGHRHPAGARLPGRPRPEARGHLARLQPAAAGRAWGAASPTPSAASRPSGPTSPAELLPLVEDTAGSSTPSCWCSPSGAACGSTRCRSTGIDDPDSRVDVLRTAIDDLHGIVRLRRTIAAGRLPLAAVRERIGRHPAEARGARPGAGQFASRGRAWPARPCTWCLFAWLAGALPSAQTANLLALLVATVANTAANRRWTFGVRGWHGLGRQHLQALAVFGLTWAMSSVALLLVGSVTASPGAALQTAAIAVANLAATVVRFVVMRRWIFSGDNASAVIGTGPAAAPALEDVVRRPASAERQSA